MNIADPVSEYYMPMYNESKEINHYYGRLGMNAERPMFSQHSAKEQQKHRPQFLSKWVGSGMYMKKTNRKMVRIGNNRCFAGRRQHDTLNAAIAC